METGGSPDKQPKEPEAKAGKSKDIKFGAVPRFGTEKADFPTMDEAKGKTGKSPQKKEDKHPRPKKEYKPDLTTAPESTGEPAVVPSFTNTKKKDAGPTFTQLKTEEKPKPKETELVAEPYKEKAPREFQVKQNLSHKKVAGEDRKKKDEKPHFKKTYEDKPKKEYKKEEKAEGPKKEREKKDFIKKGPAKKETEKPVEEKKKDKKKVGDKVATFVAAPTSGVFSIY